MVRDLVFRALWALGIMVRWNRLLCRLGRYHQYQPGVCGWCGDPHVAPSQRWRRMGYTASSRTRQERLR